MTKKASENRQSSVEDQEEVSRIRERYKEALRAGMNMTQAAAYANDPRSFPGFGQGQGKLNGEVSSVGSSDTARPGSHHMGFQK